MGFIIDDMLKNISENGFTSAELKDTIRYTLAPYFKNLNILDNYILNDQILSMFGYFMIYTNNEIFKNGINEILSLYWSAFEKNADLLWDIIISAKDVFANNENLMWNVKAATPNLVPDDCYDATMIYMRHIGDTLELSEKIEINELYAVIKIVQNESFDYDSIRKASFGITISNILDKKKLMRVLKTSPVDIKLSDWRNIAYHHTYHVEGKGITCYYGKANKSFSLTIEELRDYAAQIITSCNAMDIARRVFLFDNIEILADKLDGSLKPIDRTPMKVSQLNTTFLTQGFLILDYKITDSVSEIVVEDLKNNGNLSDEQIQMRKIHSTQFLYPLWKNIPNPTLRIKYCDYHKEIILIVSVHDEICKEIASGDKGLPYLALNFTIECGYI